MRQLLLNLREAAGSSEWGSPNDAGDGNALVYRSGVHAYRHEAYTDDEQVPPPLPSLLDDLAAEDEPGPHVPYNTVDTRSMPHADLQPPQIYWRTCDALLFSRMLRFDTVAEWAKQRISRITQATAWNGQVDEEFDKLMDRHRKPKRASKKVESDKDDKEEDVAAASAAGDEQDNAEDDDPLPPVYSVMEWLATVPRHCTAHTSLVLTIMLHPYFCRSVPLHQPATAFFSAHTQYYTCSFRLPRPDLPRRSLYII